MTIWKLGDRPVASAEEAAGLAPLQDREEAYHAACNDSNKVLTRRTFASEPVSLGKAALAGLAMGAPMAALGAALGAVTGIVFDMNSFSLAAKVGAAVLGGVGLVAGSTGSYDDQKIDYTQAGYLYHENGKSYFEAFPSDGDDIYYGCPRFELNQSS